MSNPRRRQHRSGPSVGSLAATAVVAYGTYRLANWAWSAWSDDNNDEEQVDANQQEPVVSGMREFFGADSPTPARSNSRQRWRLRRQRMERCREETTSALGDFLPTLRRAIEKLTDTTEGARALRELRDRREENRSGEKELWDQIKTKAVTRMIATAYAHSILFLVLTVQVHLLGGRLFEEQMKGGGVSMGADSLASERMGSYQASHRFVLTRTYDFFFERGLELLVATVERAVVTVMGDWDVTNPSSINTSKESLDGAIKEICAIVEGRTRNSSRRPRSILRFLLPPEHGVNSTVPDELAQVILDETWDLLESPVFEDAQRDCLVTTFEIMRDKSWSKIFQDRNSPSHTPPTFVAVPLANVVTKLKHTSNSFYKEHQSSDQLFSRSPSVNRYVAVLEAMPSVLELGDVSFN